MSAQSIINELLELAAVIDEFDALLQLENFEREELCRYVHFRRRFTDLLKDLHPLIDPTIVELKEAKGNIFVRGAYW
jgi:hypothetical protein